jgi:hypothetical protein
MEVLLRKTLAPGTGLFFSSLTTPFTSFCAETIKEEHRKRARYSNFMVMKLLISLKKKQPGCSYRIPCSSALQSTQ